MCDRDARFPLGQQVLYVKHLAQVAVMIITDTWYGRCTKIIVQRRLLRTNVSRLSSSSFRRDGGRKYLNKKRPRGENCPTQAE